jgi:predicted nucleic-acid-binding protein
MKGLDTNVLVRFLTQDDPDQSRKAAAVIEGAARRGESCRLDSVVLCELVWVLREAYEYGKRDICTALEKLLSTAEITVDEKELAHRALEDYRRGGDFADHLIGWRNHSAGCDTTYSFDRSLKGSDRFTVL